MRKSVWLIPLVIIPALALAAGNSGVLSWTAPTTNTDGSAITGAISYNVYSVPSGTSTSGGTMIATAITAVTYTVTGQSDGSSDCYAITAVVAGKESAYSNAVCKTFPAGTPNAPANLTIQ